MTPLPNQLTDFKKEGKKIIKIVVFLDGEPWATLDPETVVRERLKKGETLDAARQAAVLLTDETIRARKAAAGHSARTPKTRLELEHYLRGRKFSEPAIEAALATLAESGTVDDERAADKIVHLRRRKRDIGPRRLEAELQARGIRHKAAERHVSEAMAGVDQQAECLELARKFVRRYEPLEDPAQRNKLAQALLRRGYESDVVWNTMARLAAERNIEETMDER